MERVFEIIEEQLHLTGVELTEDLSLKDDLGADSIDLVELVMALEDEYGVEVQYEELEKKVKTVGDIVEFLKEQGADV
ncbi:MAG: acyl carrier protein [Lachnospiraceae bacterium]|nr:acyl carrier protein [Lachnospiraceae bacterium]MBO5144233.1 acyl carrier protein [Lachnospiraceae bacterium]